MPKNFNQFTNKTSMLNTDRLVGFSSATTNGEFKVLYSDFIESIKDSLLNRTVLCESVGEKRMCVSSYGNSFFIMQDGTLRACGVNRNGAIGTGRANNEKVTLPNICAFSPAIATTDKVLKVVYNYDSSYVVTEDGLLYTTGYNAQGQLGLGDTTNRFVFTRVTGGGLNGETVKDVQAGTGNSAGSNAVHVLTNSGKVYSFGDGSSGSLGLGTTTNVSTPTLVTGGIGSKTITQILTLGGGNYPTAFALANDGTVWSAGNNANGQLGRTTGDNKLFQQIIFPQNIVKLWGAGDNQYTTVWARGVDGTIYGWGYNGTYRAIGNNSTAIAPIPVGVIDLAPSGGAYVDEFYGSVDTNSVTMFAQYTNGVVKSWGRNASGQLGNGTQTAVSTPTIIAGWPFASTNIVDIEVASTSSANSTTAIITTDGSIYTAGYGGYGQLGNGLNTAAQTTFQRALFDYKVGTPTQILMGNHDTANLTFFKALLNNGKVLSWGYQAAATPQLGTDATPNPEYAPVMVLFS
jgi:alpha-tubulin suppressor-like RCC1 family protein